MTFQAKDAAKRAHDEFASNLSVLAERYARSNPPDPPNPSSSVTKDGVARME